MKEAVSVKSLWKQRYVVLGLVCVSCVAGRGGWGQEPVEPCNPVVPVLLVTGSVDGSEASVLAEGLVDGGNGGLVEIRTGADVPVADEPYADELTSDELLDSGDYFYRRVISAQRIGPGSLVDAPLLTLTVRGQVKIYCQRLFEARIVADFTDGPPTVEIFAGQPLVTTLPITGPGGAVYFPGMTFCGRHVVELEMSPGINDEAIDGGRFVFHTSAVGRVTTGESYLWAQGGEGRKGGRGGNGGIIRFCGNNGGLSASINVDGGQGAAANPPALGGRGGNGGQVSVRVNGGDEVCRVSFYCYGSGGDGGDGAAGGGAGGTGGRIAVEAKDVRSLAIGVSGGRGGAGGNAGGNQQGSAGSDGGAGGQGGTVWCTAETLEHPGSIHVNGGSGGAGGSGGYGDPGGAGGHGGDGGPGGTLDWTANDITLGGGLLYGGNGGNGGAGSGSYAGNGGRGGDGGLAGQAAQLFGLESVLDAEGLAPGMTVSEAQYPNGLDFRWYDGLRGRGGNGGGSGNGKGGDGGNGSVGGDGGDAYTLTATAGDGGDGCPEQTCSGIGLCVVVPYPAWVELQRWAPRPGTGGRGYSGQVEGADGSIGDCAFNEAVAVVRPQMPCTALLTIDLQADLNNDGLIESDRLEVGDAVGVREYLFVNDDVSNGSWDNEDPDAPTGSPDDDTQQIRIEVNGASPEAERGIWFEHPAMDHLEFYPSAQCSPDEMIVFPVVITEWSEIPAEMFIRARPTEMTEQISGALELHCGSPDGSVSYGSDSIELAVVRAPGDSDYFNAAVDYIHESNSRYHLQDIFYGQEVVTVVTMRRRSVRMTALDAYWGTLPVLNDIYEVADAFGFYSVFINGNFRIDQDDPVQHLGILVHNGCVAPISADSSESSHWLAGPEGYYVAQKADGTFEFAQGEVPVFRDESGNISGVAGGIVEAMGGLNTRWDSIASKGGSYTIIAALDADNGTELEELLVLAQEKPRADFTTATSNQVLAVRNSLLDSGADEHRMCTNDGGASTALALKDPDGSVRVKNRGARHSTLMDLDYWQIFEKRIYTYLLFETDRPRR